MYLVLHNPVISSEHAACFISRAYSCAISKTALFTQLKTLSSVGNGKKAVKAVIPESESAKNGEHHVQVCTFQMVRR